MIERGTQHHAEPQRELRFAPAGPELGSALRMLGMDNEALVISSIRKMRVDRSNKYHVADFVEYDKGIQGFSNNGLRTFALTGNAREVYSGGRMNGVLVGINLQLSIPSREEQEIILRPPFMGPQPWLPPDLNRNAQVTLDNHRDAGILPLRYVLQGRPSDYFSSALEEVRRVLAKGAEVNQLRLEPDDAPLEYRNTG